MNDLTTYRQEVYDYIHNMLGGGMVDVELDPVHYATALTKLLLDLDNDQIIVSKKAIFSCQL